MIIIQHDKWCAVLEKPQTCALLTMSLRNALNGVFAIYKPTGWTSRDAINFVQNTLSRQLGGDAMKRIRDRDKLKIGHGGTLVKFP